MITTINVTEELIDWCKGDGEAAFKYAVVEAVLPGCMPFVGAQHLTLYGAPREEEVEPATIFLTDPAVIDWLAVAAAGEDIMHPISFRLDIPEEYLARRTRRAA